MASQIVIIIHCRKMAKRSRAKRSATKTEEEEETEPLKTSTLDSEAPEVVISSKAAEQQWAEDEQRKQGMKKK